MGINDTTVAVVGEHVIDIYKIKEYPSLEHSVKIDNEIEKVFYSDQYIGVVLDNSDSGDLYKLDVYNTSGKEMFNTTYGVQYTNVQFDGKRIVLSNDASFVVMNMKGKMLADMKLDMPVTNVLSTGNKGEYILINSKYIQTIKLK